jgi:arabinogalactan oligomer / maltooligosaccharide transport system permease protein
VERESVKRPALSFTWGLVAKLFLLAAANGVALAALPRMIDSEKWLGVAVVIIATLAIDVVYLSPARFLPAKYLLPMTIMLVVFQLYPVLYTFSIAFTNYSTAHNVTKDQAISTILANSEIADPNAPAYFVTFMVSDAGDLALLLTAPDGTKYLGTSQELRQLAETDIGGEPNAAVVDAFHQVGLAEANARIAEFAKLRIPGPTGTIQLNPQNQLQATTTIRSLEYHPDTNEMVNTQTGKVYREVEGAFVSDEGDALNPGWRVVIGFDNFSKIFTSKSIRGPFFRAFIWNYIFATLTVFLQFSLGLAIALAISHSRLRGKRIYRSLLVIPFALPSYLTSLMWAGLLNQGFGPVNRLLHTNINWLGDPRWQGLIPKLSILLVTMWLGFPYFFLVSTGALTSIPGELVEAASVDGASGWYTFRTVKFPLLMTALAPLLISSFAFNFNNFNAVYLLTGGGPPIAGAQTPAGHTDILITYTYRLAFEAGRGAQYGFAAAISLIIFVMVMAITVVSFRATRTLEQVR